MVAELVLHADDGMGLDEAIAAYLAACDVEGKSPRTVDAYAETLGMFHAICLQRGLPQRVAEFRPAHVYAFLKVIADRGVSLGTRHRRFRETRAFFSWCTRMGGCARSPFTGIPNVKVEQKVIQPLTEGDIQALLAVCDSGEEFGCRNRAIILLFLDTGMRYAELHQLTLADVSWENRRIHIRHGKGRKQRVVPFGDGPEAALRDYVEGFRGEDDGPLFLTISRWGEPRRPMNKYLLGTLFARLLQRGVAVRHEPIRAWEGRVAPLLADRRRAKRRGHAGRSWSLDETDVHVAGRWCSLSRALDREGGLLDSLRSAHRDTHAARRVLRRLVDVAERKPQRVTTEAHPPDRLAIRWILGSKGRHRCHQSLINRIEQDHRAVTQRSRPLLGCGSFASAVRCCSAFAERRQDCRVRQRRGAQVPLAKQRRLFVARWRSLIAERQAASWAPRGNASLGSCRRPAI